MSDYSVPTPHYDRAALPRAVPEYRVRGTDTLAQAALSAVLNPFRLDLAANDLVYVNGTHIHALARTDAQVEVNLHPQVAGLPLLDVSHSNLL